MLLQCFKTKKTNLEEITAATKVCNAFKERLLAGPTMNDVKGASCFYLSYSSRGGTSRSGTILAERNFTSVVRISIDQEINIPDNSFSVLGK